MGIDGIRADGTSVNLIFWDTYAELGFGPEFDNLTSLRVSIFPRQGPTIVDLFAPPLWYTGPLYGVENVMVPPGRHNVYDCQKVCVGADIRSLTLEPIGAPAPGQNEVAPVPLPASLPLAALGLLALGLVSRRPRG